MVGGFVAAFLFAEIISVSGLYLDLEWAMSSLSQSSLS